MKKEFIVNRQGKEFVLYAGLLDEAHKDGLKRISTTLVQAPRDDNGHTAICWAEVETDRGIFTGIGDANPENVGRMIALHCIRMAETRAKARALRDAINVGVTSLEELGDLDEETHGKMAPGRSDRSPREPRSTPTAPARPAASARPATAEPPPLPEPRRIPTEPPTNAALSAPAVTHAKLVEALHGVPPVDPPAKEGKVVPMSRVATVTPATAANPVQPIATALLWALQFELTRCLYNEGDETVTMPEDDLPFDEMLALANLRIELNLANINRLRDTEPTGKPKADGPIAAVFARYTLLGVPLILPTRLSQSSAAWLNKTLTECYQTIVKESKPMAGATP